MERVLVIGSPGAGKSTLARALARSTRLPLFHLDQIYWRAGWVEPAKDVWAQEVAALVAKPSWIIEGNYGGTLPLRLTRADTVIWLDLPVWICLIRIMRRAIMYRGLVRPDMAEGCPERMNWEFFSYTALFRWRGRRRLIAKLPAFAGTLFRLRSPREAALFLAGLN